jgi:hypothetical protein
MRNCPHCSNEIQDEAVYCRHCHEEVEPPLWLSSMVRCHFCAEWIDGDSEDCPYCRKNLIGIDQTPQTAPFIDSSVDALIEGFRAATSDETEDQEVELSVPEPSVPSPLEEPPPKTDLSTFRSQMLERKPLWEKLPGLSRKRDDDGTSTREPISLPTSSPVFRIAVAIIAIGIVAVIAVGILRNVDFTGTAAAPVATETALPQATATRIQLPTQTAEVGAGESTQDVPTNEPTETNCVSWDEVTVEDTDSEMCVFGIVKRWFAVPGIPFVAIFSEELGTFAFVDRTTAHSQVRSGMCITGTGVIEVRSGIQPNIDLQGVLQFCPEP